MSNHNRIDTRNTINEGQVTKSNVTGTTIGDKRYLDTIAVPAPDSVTAGERIHLEDSEDTITAGSKFTVMNETVPAGKTRYLRRVIVTTRASGKFEISINGTKVGSGRTNASNMNVVFDFNPVISAGSGEDIDIEFTMLFGKVGQTVEVYLMATDE